MSMNLDDFIGLSDIIEKIKELIAWTKYEKDYLKRYDVNVYYDESAGQEVIEGMYDLEMPDFLNIKQIPMACFASDYGLRKIKLPKSVKKIGGMAFTECKSLEEVVAEGLENWVPEENYGTVIDDYTNSCFMSCENLKSVDFAKNLTTLPTYCFMYCNSLKKVDLPNLKTLHGSTFNSCNGIESVNLPNLEDLSSDEFQNCINLKNVDVPNLIKISNSCFSNCPELKSINAPNVVETMSEAFFNCEKLETVNLSKVEKIRARCFGNCKNLKALKLPKIQVIASSTFYSCSKLETLEFGADLKEIDGGNSSLNALNTVTIHATKVPVMKSANAFQKNAGLKIYVPASAIDKYKVATNWSTYADCMIGIEGE